MREGGREGGRKEGEGESGDGGDRDTGENTERVRLCLRDCVVAISVSS